MFSGSLLIFFPTSYLGQLFGAKFKEKSIGTSLSKGLREDSQGAEQNIFPRLTLIKNVLLSIPTYFRSLFPVPSSIATKLESNQRKSLWGYFGSDFRYHLVRWNIVKHPMLDGGSVVRDLKIFNMDSLDKRS